MIDLSGLRVGYGDFLALGGVTARVPEGAVGLLGPNGAGKSTLIKTLLGQIRPRAGAATVLGLDVVTRFLEIRQRVGYMPERDCLFPGLNGISAVAYAGRLVGMSAGDAKQRAHEVLNYVGIADERYRPVESYSAGMLQRIKLAQALVHDPGLLFLDEPTNGMDPRGRAEMLELIRDVSRNKGIHILLSSHLLPDVEAVCTEVVVLSKGEVLATGNIDAMRQGDAERFHVRVKGDEEGFRGALAAGGCRVGDSERGVFAVDTDGATTDVLWRAARETGVQIRHLAPARRTLEDVFLDAVERSGEGLRPAPSEPAPAREEGA